MLQRVWLRRSVQPQQTLAEVTANSDIIITVVTDDAYAQHFLRDDNLTDSNGKTFLNCKNLSPDIHIELEEAVASNGGGGTEVCMALPQARG